MPRGDDGGAVLRPSFEAFALGLRLSQRGRKIDMTLLVATEIDFQIGHIGAGAGHLAFSDENILAGAA